MHRTHGIPHVLTQFIFTAIMRLPDQHVPLQSSSCLNYLLQFNQLRPVPNGLHPREGMALEAPFPPASRNTVMLPCMKPSALGCEADA